MSTPTRTLPLTRLHAIHNARTRIFAAGADPKFGRNAQPRTLQLLPAWPIPTSNERPKAKAQVPWKPDVLDRLQAPLTRYHE